MKILFLGAYLPYPLTSGGRIRSYHLLRELSVQHEIHLLTLNHGDCSEANMAPLQEMCCSVRTVPAPARLEGLSHRLRRLLHAPQDIVFGKKSPEIERALDDYLERERWDLLILDDMGVTEYIEQAAHTPTLLSKHNCEWQLLRRYARRKVNRVGAWGLARLEAFATRRYEAKTLRSVDCVIAVSQQDRDAFRQLAPAAEIHVAPNGVDTAYFTPTSTQPDNRLIFTGAMFWYPNIDAVSWFCESIWPAVLRDIPDAGFDIAGCDPPNAIRALGKLPGLRVIPNVPDIRPHLAGSAASVVPLRVGSGSRLKILEALASGKSVITTSIGMEGLDLIPDEEIILANDPPAFASACVEILRNQVKRTALNEAGRKAVLTRYDWSIVLADWNRICDETRKRE